MWIKFFSLFSTFHSAIQLSVSRLQAFVGDVARRSNETFEAAGNSSRLGNVVPIPHGFGQNMKLSVNATVICLPKHSQNG